MGATATSQQYYGTFYWAVQVGFPVGYAKKIAYNCNDVDSIFSPLLPSYQGWHFNIARSCEEDSRIVRFTFMYLAAFACFDDAMQKKKNGQNYSVSLNFGLMYLGYALHPIFKIKMKKEEAALINTWFFEFIIFSGLKDRGVFL